MANVIPAQKVKIREKIDKNSPLSCTRAIFIRTSVIIKFRRWCTPFESRVFVTLKSLCQLRELRCATRQFSSFNNASSNFQWCRDKLCAKGDLLPVWTLLNESTRVPARRLITRPNSWFMIGDEPTGEVSPLSCQTIKRVSSVNVKE